MEQDMTKGRILPLIIKFMIPLLIGDVFQMLYNMVDTIIVGRFVGADALAAVGSTGGLMYLIGGFAIGITAGFTVLTSQRYGAGDRGGVKVSVATGIELGFALSAILTVLFWAFAPQILKLMNTPASVYRDALAYIRIICLGTLCTVFYNLCSAFLRAVGNSRAPLYFLVFSACLNVGLDLLFIITFHAGVGGAATATVLSQGISAVLCAVYTVLRVPVLIPSRDHWRPKRWAVAFEIRMGIPMALQYAITDSGIMIMQAAINLFGADAVASFTAASKIQNILMQGMIAMGQTMATFCGQNAGARDLGRLLAGAQGREDVVGQARGGAANEVDEGRHPVFKDVFGCRGASHCAPPLSGPGGNSPSAPFRRGAAPAGGPARRGCRCRRRCGCRASRRGRGSRSRPRRAG